MKDKEQNKSEQQIKVPVKQRSASFSPPLKYKIASDEEINLTKARAFQFLELKTFEGERPVRERHVQFLFDDGGVPVYSPTGQHHPGLMPCGWPTRGVPD